MDEITKARFSLDGWNFWDWLKGNGDTIIETVKVGAPLILGMEFFADKPVLVFLVVGIGKLAADTFHYWIKQK